MSEPVRDEVSEPVRDEVSEPVLAGHGVDLVHDLAALLNRHSREGASDTPDFVLAEYLVFCLEVFERGVRQREVWWGRHVAEQIPPSLLVDFGDLS